MPTGLSGQMTSLAEFLELANDHRFVPVTCTVLADAETPLSAYRKLADGRPGTFLLESAENGRSWSRWSFIGTGAPSALVSSNGQARWVGHVPQGMRESGDPFELLSDTIESLTSRVAEIDGLAPFHGGFVGYMAYDIVRHIERLPELTRDDLEIPEMLMLLATDVAVFDHHQGTITLIANAVNWNGTRDRAAEAYEAAVGRVDDMISRLSNASSSTVSTYSTPEPTFDRQRSESEYTAIVESLVEEIEAGEAFQVVPSMRFEMDTAADPLDVYRMLRASNPSPYMYLVSIPDVATATDDGFTQTAFTVVGSSPEALVSVQNSVATTHPIAGTRWRGATEEEDLQLGKDLENDAKENAEHLMLVDLGRNDLGRVCTPGTVHVHDYCRIERYSHVMHLVSTVSGQLRDGCNAVDAVKACFPAGTLTGAPKIRAMELIEEREETRRGLYGGIVGYFDLAGNADTAIAIRTALIKNGRAYVQAGGGVVADSVGTYEFNEANFKAKAVLRALAAAETIKPADSQLGEK